MGLLDFDYDKLGGNALLQAGLGILANNQGHGGQFAPAFGQGAMQGLQQAHEYKLRQQKELLLKQQADRQDQLLALQQQTAQRGLDADTRKTQALDDFAAKFPEYAEAARLDPGAAVKAAYPNLSANTATPYTDVVYDGQGNAYLQNHRETDPTKALVPISINGRSFTGAKYSPELAGSLKSAQALAGASYKPNTDINGLVSTDAQVAQQAYGGQPMPFSGGLQQSSRVPAPVQRQRDDKRLQILLAEQASDGGAGMNPDLDKEIARMSGGQVPRGIKIPTKAELAASVKSAELNAENTTKAQIELPSSIAQAENTLGLVDQLVGSKDGKIAPHAGFNAATGLSSKIDPRNYLAGTDATDFNIRLDQLKGQQFMQAYQTLKGGGQITEVEGKKATDAISRMNTSASDKEFTQAARDFQDVIRLGINRSKLRAGNQSNIMPANEPMPKAQAMPMPAKPSALTLKAGTVYQTPRGALKWNGKAFED